MRSIEEADPIPPIRDLIDLGQLPVHHGNIRAVGRDSMRSTPRTVNALEFHVHLVGRIPNVAAELIEEVLSWPRPISIR